VTALSINLNKIALLRNSRSGDYPSVTAHALRTVAAGADGITVHPRPDQRHVRARDCGDLAAILTVEFNIEGNPFAGPMASRRADVEDYPGFMEIVRRVRPAQCTLVPDTDQQLTSDHGFDLLRDGERLRPVVTELKSMGIRVSLFMDPEPAHMALARDVGADRVELYTEAYARACERSERAAQECLAQYVDAAIAADDAGLGVNAGHDLNLHNLERFAQAVPRLLEVSIGHAFTVDCIEYGIAETMRRYRHCLGKPS